MCIDIHTYILEMRQVKDTNIHEEKLRVFEIFLTKHIVIITADMIDKIEQS